MSTNSSVLATILHNAEPSDSQTLWSLRASKHWSVEIHRKFKKTYGVSASDRIIAATWKFNSLSDRRLFELSASDFLRAFHSKMAGVDPVFAHYLLHVKYGKKRTLHAILDGDLTNAAHNIQWRSDCGLTFVFKQVQLSEVGPAEPEKKLSKKEQDRAKKMEKNKALKESGIELKEALNDDVMWRVLTQHVGVLKVVNIKFVCCNLCIATNHCAVFEYRVRASGPPSGAESTFWIG